MVLAEKDFKITALTLALALAYYRRINFGQKSESFSGEQRELFEETVNTDLAAIEPRANIAALPRWPCP